MSANQFETAPTINQDPSALTGGASPMRKAGAILATALVTFTGALSAGAAEAPSAYALTTTVTCPNPDPTNPVFCEGLPDGAVKTVVDVTDVNDPEYPAMPLGSSKIDIVYPAGYPITSSHEEDNVTATGSKTVETNYSNGTTETATTTILGGNTTTKTYNPDGTIQIKTTDSLGNEVSCDFVKYGGQQETCAERTAEVAAEPGRKHKWEVCVKYATKLMGVDKKHPLILKGEPKANTRKEKFTIRTATLSQASKVCKEAGVVVEKTVKIAPKRNGHWIAPTFTLLSPAQDNGRAHSRTIHESYRYRPNRYGDKFNFRVITSVKGEYVSNVDSRIRETMTATNTFDTKPKKLVKPARKTA